MSTISQSEFETTLSDADFAKLRAIVHENTGISIAENRRSMMVSRLQNRLRITGERTFSGYISRVTADPAEMQELTNRVTTNETYFYRTPRVWAHLKTVVIPEFLGTVKGRPMKCWSAAASTGEEGYTIGVVLEDVRRSNPQFDYSVLGTDISSRVIEVAKKGQYIGRPVARFRKEDQTLFSKFMVGNDDDGFCVIPDIKRRVTFKLHNLVNQLKTGGPFDVIFLRNVLIYFTQEDQEKILANVHAALRPEGTLIIGESETLTSLKCSFKPIAPLIYTPVVQARKAITA